jgi:lipopolysaccharide export system permease protein
MNILDRYLTRYFIFVLVAALLAFIIIYVLIDLIENLDTFIDNQTPFSTVVKYYLLYIPFMANLTIPIAVLLSCLFTIGQMVRYNELVALKASGVSLYRVLFPLFRLGFLISLLALLFGELVVPVSNLRRAEVKQVEIKKNPPSDQQRRKNIYLQDSRNRLIYVKEFSGQTKTALSVLIQEYDGETLVERVDARNMMWKDNVWILHRAEIRSFKGDREEFRTVAEVPRPDFSFTPDDLVQRPKDPEEMNIVELKSYIRHVKRLGGDAQRWIADFHLKLAFPFTNIIIVLFGTALASVRRRSGAAVGFGISLFICFVYYTVMEVGRAMGRSGDLHPIVSAWIGNGLFGLIGLVMLVKARK